jgi:hypothetical protein
MSAAHEPQAAAPGGDGALGAFQDDFRAALYGAVPRHAQVAALAQQAGFAVYRNTVIKAGIDALEANFPTVTRLVGRDWLRAAAAIHVHETPPADARLLYYGAGFAAFLEHFEPARALPYLADVARLDRSWIEVHAALDQTSLAATALAGLAPEQWAGLVLHPLAAARWHWFEAQPAYTIWRINREARDMPPDLPWIGEGALLLRTHDQVNWRGLDAGACAFLDACAAGQCVEDAAQAALHAQPECDLARLLADLLGAGVFAAAPASGATPTF